MSWLRHHYQAKHPLEFARWGKSNPAIPLSTKKGSYWVVKPQIKIHPEAIESLKRYKKDLQAGHKDAAEYWRGQAGAYFTANPTKKILCPHCKQTYLLKTRKKGEWWCVRCHLPFKIVPNPFLSDLGTAATLGAGFMGGSRIINWIGDKMTRKKNPFEGDRMAMASRRRRAYAAARKLQRTKFLSRPEFEIAEDIMNGLLTFSGKPTTLGKKVGAYKNPSKFWHNKRKEEIDSIIGSTYFHKLSKGTKEYTRGKRDEELHALEHIGENPIRSKNMRSRVYSTFPVISTLIGSLIGYYFGDKVKPDTGGGFGAFLGGVAGFLIGRKRPIERILSFKRR